MRLEELRQQGIDTQQAPACECDGITVDFHKAVCGETLICLGVFFNDLHTELLTKIAGIEPAQVSADQRARAKAVNFGIIYGSSAFGLANQLGIATGEAQETINAYFARYSGVRRFLDETIAAARERGFVQTLLGRRRYLPEINSPNAFAARQSEGMAVNTPIQGTAAEIIKLAMIAVERRLRSEGLRSQMVLTIHDELLFDAAKLRRDI